jgi:hypothetical protein
MIFWFPEPSSSDKILHEFGYIVHEQTMVTGRGREIIEIEVPRHQIIVNTKLILKKKEKKRVFITASLV